MDLVDINVLFFGPLKTHFGSQLQMMVPKGLELRALIDMLKEKSPSASQILTSCRVAVDSELERGDFAINQSYRIAILPPFSGG